MWTVLQRELGKGFCVETRQQSQICGEFTVNSPTAGYFSSKVKLFRFLYYQCMTTLLTVTDHIKKVVASQYKTKDEFCLWLTGVK